MLPHRAPSRGSLAQGVREVEAKVMMKGAKHSGVQLM